MSLSARNQWFDAAGRIYIIFTIDEIKKALGCADKKAVKLLDELEKKYGLIERKRQGLGKPNLIYVKNFVSEPVERQFLNCQKHNSGMVESTIQELSKAQGNKTDNNKTDSSETDPFLSSDFFGKEPDEMDEYTDYYEFFSQEFEIEILYKKFPEDIETLEGILDLVVDTVCSKRKFIRIASDDKPIEIVRSRFMKLDSRHIEYILDCLRENTTDIRNMKQYLLAALYNAPTTMDSYYKSWANHVLGK